ncbi:unnamed protein product [Paramecium sonneborni]|uniref:Uncharacterized protein n=1 Tax=Paramecium sonneborni TaxID=65129 RepID=A0A8S1M1N7_9CILI|nr:unnamed protein product [Paramecium sonneborni]
MISSQLKLYNRKCYAAKKEHFLYDFLDQAFHNTSLIKGSNIFRKCSLLLIK